VHRLAGIHKKYAMPAHKVWRQAQDCFLWRRSPVHYQIRVRGRLGQTMLGAFPELRAQQLASETLLTGQLPDQAALFGVLDRIEALGLELLEVLRPEDH
jgi:hypothetical protein